MRQSFSAISYAVAALAAECGCAQAQSYERSPVGSAFVVTGSQKAPWAEGRLGEESPESRALKGKAISFAAKAITGPQPMACKKPNYERVAVEPEGLFQGGLKALVDEKAAVIRAWSEAGHLAPVDPHHLIFSIWAATQHYADFDTQVAHFFDLMGIMLEHIGGDAEPLLPHQAFAGKF